MSRASSSHRTTGPTLPSRIEDEDKTMKTFIQRSISSASILGGATLVAMLALSSTIFVGHG
jgi:hypothetical protein